MRTLDRFVEGLRAIALRDFTLERVAEYVAAEPVDPASLDPYVLFTPTHYTRNLIYRGEAFELMAICWEVGQSSRIHNHQGQRCWMAVPVGRLAVQNYEVVRQDPQTGSCELKEADRLEMDPDHPSYVQPALPVHAVLNLPEYAQRAVSLHVYSLPYDRCLVYNRQNNTYCEVPLFFDTEYGQPSEG
jgi:cysteine dioxygenase type I